MSILPQSKVDHPAALRVLEAVAECLDAHGVEWWVDYGAVLGLAREGGMIEWDSDIDLGVFLEDRDEWEEAPPLVTALLSELKSQGFGVSYHLPGETRYRGGDWLHAIEPRNPCGVDLFFWHDAEDGCLHRFRYANIDRFKGRAIPPERLFPLQRVDLDGVEVNAPADVEWFAQYRYGDSWREPVRSQDYPDHLKAQGEVE